MTRTFVVRILRTALVGAVALSAAACQHAGNYDLPARYIPEPAGTRQNVIFQMQAVKAEAEDFVLYTHHWTPGQVNLGPNGQHRLLDIVSRLDTEPFPVIIQPSGDVRLDLARQEAIEEYLVLNGIYEPEALVRVEEPDVDMIPAASGGSIVEDPVVLTQ